MWNTVNEELRSIDVILGRDQRTTSHRVLDHNAQNGSWIAPEKMQKLRQDDNVNRHRHAEMTNARTEQNDRTQRHLQDNSHLTLVSYDDRGVRSRSNTPVNVTTWLRLGSLLVISILFTVQSAPMTLEDRRLSIPPKWVNPCGLADEVEALEGSDSEIQLKDDQLLQQIVVQATTARMHTELFREKYVKDIFKLNLQELHSTWKLNRYEWLPGPAEIPKSLGEHVSMEHLQSLTLDEALLNAYEYLQKFAVGLEQIVWDQEDHQLKYRNEFKETEFKLRTVLCEIQVALVERGITQRPDVTRDIMVPSLRNMDSATYRDLRDWMIFRDYMNGLEYVVQVFEYLRAHPQHTS